MSYIIYFDYSKAIYRNNRMDSSVVKPINLTKVCRTCLSEPEELHSIFAVVQSEGRDEIDRPYVYEILMNISSIKILTEDQMPTTLCSSCLHLVNTCYKFQQQCNRSQVILETYLSHVNTIKIEDTCCEINTKEELSNAVDSGDGGSLDGSNFINVNHNCTQFTNNDSGKARTTNICKTNVKTNCDSAKNSDPEKLNIQNDNSRLKGILYLKESQKQIDDDKHFVRRKKEYACDVCGKNYKFGGSLKVHMRIHTLERPYVCKFCGKDFRSFSSLSCHLRSHSDEQPYECKVCGKKYKQSGSLRIHMRVHTGQRPFLCSICGRGFRQAPDLGYHMRTHTKEKPFMCNICGKTMSMHCHLVQHMRTHTGERPFKCTECDKAFPSTTRLKRHAIIHTGLKPYKCDVCDKSFNRTSTLRVHVKIHTDDRPHVCSVCGKGFIQLHSMKAHIATHTPTNTGNST